MIDWREYVDDPYTENLLQEMENRLQELHEQLDELDNDYENDVIEKDEYDTVYAWAETGIEILEREISKIYKECK